MALQNIELVLDNTAPLKWPRGNHLPLYLWPVMDLETEDETEIEKVIGELIAGNILIHIKTIRTDSLSK